MPSTSRSSNPDVPRPRRICPRTSFASGLTAAVLCAGYVALAAAPAIQWQQAYGGTSGERLYSQVQTADGGYLLGGYSASGTNGNKTGTNYGTVGVNGDFWIVRIDANGNKLWDKTCGGSGDDVLFAMWKTTDNGFILGGSSDSPTSGNKTAANRGAKDFWVVRMNSGGTVLWDASYGGTADDILFSVQQTSDGGFMLGGYSMSGTNGNKSDPNYGAGDFWVVKTDSIGRKSWDRSYGGTGDDGAYSLFEIPGQGYFLAGNSASPIDGTKTSENFGGYDLWVVMIASTGKQLWDYSYGGTGDDGYYNVRCVQTLDGGYLVGCESLSGANGNKTSPNRGGDDFWVVRLDDAGQALWDRSFGGTGYDELTEIARTPDGGFLLAGLTDSGITGNKTSPNRGSTDAWLVRVDADGNRAWDATYGGTLEDAFVNATVIGTSDGGLLLGCDSNSGINGNKTVANIDSRDYWVLKLKEAQPPTLRAEPQTDIAVNGFRFYLSGQLNQFYVLEKKLEAQGGAWTPFRTNQLTQQDLPITDPTAAGQDRGFYRAREWP